ncbi:MAG: hypothetical protein ACXW31_00300 [Thermoanaerobaculia bacterium]
MALVIIAVVAQLSFTFSGSNKWESLGERDGIQLYELKSPGKNIKQYKAVWKVRSTMSRFVAFAKTEDSDMTIGYYDMRDLEAPSEQVVFSTWKQKFPKPFQPRQFVVKNEFIQDPATKVLVYNVMAATEKLPADDCCVRVPTMNNSWTLKPLGNGEIQVEWISDLDMGGFLPYFTLNAFQPGGMRYFARNLQRFLEQEKYDNVKFAWIQEP